MHRDTARQARGARLELAGKVHTRQLLRGTKHLVWELDPDQPSHMRKPAVYPRRCGGGGGGGGGGESGARGRHGDGAGGEPAPAQASTGLRLCARRRQLT